MFYPDEIIEEVRSRNDIVDVIGSYVKLQKKGGNHWACCPFHNEDTPSFSVNGNKQMYHCFGCNVSGNVYTFVMQYENMSFPEAVRYLAERAGVQLPEIEYTEEQKQKANRRARLMEINKEAAKFYYYQLRSPRGQIGLDYFKKRELSEETMNKFGLGYSGKSGAELVTYLRSKGYEDELIKEVGLAYMNERSGLASQFWNRVMYPIFDVGGKVIGFGGRVMGEGEPKYLNSPETPVFDKRRNLYGLNFARTSRSGNIILCEGYMDVIAMHQAGFTQAVASLGTALTAEQANLIRKYTENVYIAYDSDGAGTKAALRGIGILRDAKLTAKVINMKPYKDPDEFMKALGKEEFQKRIDQAENSFFFEIRILEGQFDMSDPDQKTRFHREIARKLCEFRDELERENYLQSIANKYYIGADNLRKMVTLYATESGAEKPVVRPKSGMHQKASGPEESARKAQRLLITWITDEPSCYGKVRKYISVEDFTDPIYRHVAEKLFDEMDRGIINPAALVSQFSEEEEQRAAAEMFNTNLPELSTKQEREKALHDIVLAVKKNSYEYMASNPGGFSDITKMIEGKKALEELAKARITLD